MDSLKPVLAVLARVMMMFAPAFLVPMAWAWALDDRGLPGVWLLAFAGTAGGGWLLWRATQRHRRELQPRDGILLVNLVWVTLTACSALPLMATIPGLSWTDACFEAMSALTATGATVLSGLDALPVSVNVWRCFLQLIGGLGIMLLVVASICLRGNAFVEKKMIGNMCPSVSAPKILEGIK